MISFIFPTLFTQNHQKKLKYGKTCSINWEIIPIFYGFGEIFTTANNFYLEQEKNQQGANHAEFKYTWQNKIVNYKTLSKKRHS